MFLTLLFVSIFRSTVRVSLKSVTTAKKGKQSKKVKPKKSNSNTTDPENRTPAKERDHKQPSKNESKNSHGEDKKSDSDTTDQEKNRNPAKERDHEQPSKNESKNSHGEDKKSKKSDSDTNAEAQEKNRNPAMKNNHGDKNEPIAVSLPEAKSLPIGSASIAAELVTIVAQKYPLSKLASNEIVAEFSDDNDTSGLGSEMMSTSTDSFVRNAIEEIDKTEKSVTMQPDADAQEVNRNPAMENNHESKQLKKAEPAKKESNIDSNEGDAKSTDAEAQEKNRTPAMEDDHDNKQSKKKAKQAEKDGDKNVILSQESISQEAKSSLIGSTSNPAELVTIVTQKYPFSDDNDMSGRESEMMSTSTESCVRNAIEEIDKTVEKSVPMRPEESRLRDLTWKATDKNFSCLSTIEISDIDGDVEQKDIPTHKSHDDSSDSEDAKPLSSLLQTGEQVDNDIPTDLKSSAEQTVVSKGEHDPMADAMPLSSLLQTVVTKGEHDPTGEHKVDKAISTNLTSSANMQSASNDEYFIHSEEEDSMTFEELIKAPTVARHSAVSTSKTPTNSSNDPTAESVAGNTEMSSEDKR